MDQNVQQLLDEGLFKKIVGKDGEPRFQITEKGIQMMCSMSPEEFEAMAREMGWLHNVH